MNILQFAREDYLACSGHCQTQVLGTEERQLRHSAAAMKPGPTLSESIAFVVAKVKHDQQIAESYTGIATSSYFSDFAGCPGDDSHS